MPTPQEILTNSGTGILPVSYIGARCEFKLIQPIPCMCSTEKPGFLNRISLEARTVKKPGFWGVLFKPGIGCILQQYQSRTFARGGGGFFSLLVSLKAIGEPAPCILKEVDCDLLLGGGGLIQIVGTGEILLVNPPLVS